MSPVPIDPRTPDRPWGFIHPTDSGIEWQVRSGGMDVRYIRFEGIFFPLPRPVGNGQDILITLHEAN